MYMYRPYFPVSIKKRVDDDDDDDDDDDVHINADLKAKSSAS